MNEKILGIFIDYNIILDDRTNRHHLVGICKVEIFEYVLLITGPVVQIAYGKNAVKTHEGVYYIQSSEKMDFYQELLNSMPPSSIERGRRISNCSLLFH